MARAVRNLGAIFSTFSGVWGGPMPDLTEPEGHAAPMHIHDFTPLAKLTVPILFSPMTSWAFYIRYL